MNFRTRTALQHPGIQLAPLVDVLLLRNENELDVKVPKASAAKEKMAPPGDVVVNVKTDGSVIVNRRTMSGSELGKLLQDLVKLYPEQAVVIRGDESGAYKNVVNILNICSESGITNVAFATAK